jgi:homogentisate 1,2-dioxygenase
MPFYRRVGDVPRKRHSRAPGGSGSSGLLHEELIGEEGFAGDSALLYHRHSPSAITAAEVVVAAADEPAFTPDLPVLPRHLRTGELARGGDLVTGRQRLLGNADVRLSVVHATESSGLHRDVTGDHLVYLQEGRATLVSSFGRLDVAAGDYVVVPTGTTHRWDLGPGGGPVTALVLEATSHVTIPERYRSASGQLRDGAPYCERDLRGPHEPVLEEGEDVPVLVRTRAGLTTLVHARHPFDVVGWDGWLYPWALSIHDFEPVVGSLHQPPPVHQTFAGRGFVVCSFVPRPFDFHPDAVKVPYHHANVDSDEVLFYSAGDFMSRAGSGIGVGSISYHPAGFVHGPQPGSVERSFDAERTEELAVMLDTFQPLGVSAVARAVADDAYPWTWSGAGGAR